MQVASSFLIEIGNEEKDKFLFDMGSGSYQNLLATGNYAIDKVSTLHHCHTGENYGHVRTDAACFVFMEQL